MKLSFILVLTTAMHVTASISAQNVSLKGKGMPLKDVFSEMKKQTGFNFFYTDDDLAAAGKLDVNINAQPLAAALEALLREKSLTYSIVDKVVIIKKKENTSPEPQPAAPPLEITGKVTNEKGEPLPGMTVMIIGTKIGVVTNASGMFSIRAAKEGPVELSITGIGFKLKAVKVKNSDNLTIVMEAEATKMNEVVISTGMFNRKRESFTGAVSTFTKEELRTVTNQNVLKALAILDPSFQIMDNLDAGSNPNRLPDIQLRGQTGFPDLKGDYTTNPNLPLFILDGFETTLEKVNDMNMNLVQSITILKDASAKAIWGSKAGNGVVVIETKAPASGQLRLSYTGSMDVMAPDLTSYKLTNSMQKVQAEVLSGKYSSPYPATEAQLLREYSTNLQAALEGVNTYWLSQPLRNGIGQRHGLNLEGGNDGFRYSANMNYNNVVGVMQGSDRNTVSGGINLIYRKNNFQFRNSLTVDKNRSDNSPYGSFTNVARMNPYWRMKDANGNYIVSYNNGAAGNPMYDGSLNSKDFTTYFQIIENFYADWDIARNLRVTARVGITKQDNDLQKFTPASHSMYATIQPNTDAYLDRGEYSIQNGKQNNINGDLLANYYFNIGKHNVYLNGAYTITQANTSTNGMTMVGFPNDKMDDISFGRRYKDGTKAAGTENTSRSVAITSAVSYSYDEKYLADFSYRGNASSQFGADKRWGLFWSVGAGWNLHKEKFMQDLKFVNMFKLRGSVGTTGTQNFNSYQSIATYQYIVDRTYNGDMGLDLLALPNPYLQWQQVKDNNIGADLFLFNLLSIRFDYYIRDTKNLLSDMVIAPSNGFETYKSNIGESRNKGFQAGVNMRVFNNSNTRTSVNVFANVAHNTNRIRKVSNSLEQLNQEADNDKGGTSTGNAANRRPSTRFVPGQSMSAIWVVPSRGIDPANGKEIFVKRDGTLTYVWSTDDYIVGGDSNPLYNGTFGVNVLHKGITANFAFAFRAGGQQYNTTLVSRVENADFNYNVDVRALTERWRQPGDKSLFKDIADRTDTRPTSRFLQDMNELLFSSVSLGYDFGTARWLEKIHASRVSFLLNLNDLARISTVKTERGLDYPYARTISGSLQVTF
ncbi:SusC/RagA family TonB-linked outer membrane protein [Chitinophaga horti]|uniref:SusC/RagA family TonB-linked outer membrane protein n=1 Tax=Chitinophaga horti TaxID=2920382 RepID=A0ABY6JCB2_9BACT|nr:SusC/RagA family TonB-linked outer membrane protein [Chitinophaga horti]UYQ95844.1 SusC/RagA family TonB-linked outer membrane protein [Chitinophaga horti]